MSSLFDRQAPATGVSFNDNTAVELGMRFLASADGSVTELRYWRAAGDAGDTDVRTGRIWDDNGNLLGTVTFTSAPGESGWQVAELDAPVEIDANTAYTVSYRTTDNYIATIDFFATEYVDSSGQLTAPSGQNGVYAYGGSVTLPTQSYRQTNYWVDVSFVLDNNLPPVADSETATVLEDGSVVIDVVAGDTDAEDGVPDPATVEIEAADDAGGRVKTVAGEGVWSVDAATGAITFTPEPNYAGAVTPIAYTIADSAGLRSAPASVSVTITPVNDAPVADAETATVLENGSVVIDVVAGDTDVEDGVPDPATVEIEAADNAGGQIKTVAGEGVWSVDAATGAITFTPEPSYVGAVTPIAYTIADSEGLRSAPAAVSVTIAAGTAPVADPETATVVEDGSVVIDVVAGDTDAEDGVPDPATVEIEAADDAGGQVKTVAGEGVWSVDAATGAITFTPEPNYAGAVTPIAYTIADSAGLRSAPASVSVTITPVNDAPVADAETATVLENGSVVIDVVAGDTDVEDGAPDPATVEIEAADNAGGQIKTVAGEGVWSVDAATGAITFTPEPDYAGAVTPIAYTIADSAGLRSAPAAVSVTITPPPVPVITLFDPLDPVTGTLSNDNKAVELGMRFLASADGSVTELRYWRAAGDAGDTDVRTGRIWDDNGNLLGTVTFTSAPGESGWQVAELDAPVEIDANTEYTVSYRTTDNYIATINFFATEYVDSSGQLTAPSGQNGVYAYGGSVTLPTQSYRQTNYWVDVSFVLDNNLPPVADSETATVLEDGSVVIDVVAGDTDAEDGVPDPATVEIEAADDAGGQVKTVAGEGVWSVDAATGAITFTPEPNYAGAVTPIAYTIADSAGLRSAPASVSVTITPVNDAPVADAETATVLENGSVVIDVVAGDTDVEDGVPDPATVEIEAADNAGGQIKTVAGEGVWSVDAATGAITFTPEPSYVGAVTPIAYTIADSEGLRSAPAAVSVTIAAGTAPVADPETATVVEDGSVVIDVVAGDTDAEDGVPDPATVEIEAADDAGGQVKTVAGEGVWSVDAATGAITFTPEPNYAGAVTPIAYTIADSAGLRSAPASVSVTITPVNDAPVADAETATVLENGSVVIDVVAGDTDVEDGAPDPATVEIEAADNAGGQIKTVAGEGVWSVDAATGAITFTPEPDYAGAVTPIAYTIADSAGLRSAPAAVSVTITPPPVPVITLFDPLDPVTGTLSNDNKAVELGMRFLASADGSVTELRYWRAAGDAGDTDVRTGRIWDDNGNLLGTVTFTSAPGESGWQVAELDAPVEIDANTEYTVSYRTTDNYIATINFFATEYVDSSGQLTAPSGQNGVYAYGGSVTLPTQSYRQTNYWVDVSFVLDNNLPPVADSETATVLEDGSVVIDVVAGDTDAEDGVPDPATVEIEAADDAGGQVKTVAGEGVWSVDAATGAITFTPEPNYAGAVTPIAYTIADSAGLRSAPASVSVTITPVNDAPVADAETATVPQNGSVVIDVVAGDTDVEDGVPDPATVEIEAADNAGGQIKTVAGEGVWSVDAATGAITFTPEPSYVGAVTPIAYTIADSEGLRSAPAAVSVTIAAGTAPVADPETATVVEDGSVVIDVVAGDTDAEDGVPDPATVEIEAADDAGGQVKTVAGEGVWSVDAATGAITFTPEPNYAGAVTPIAYTIADSAGLRSAPASVSVTITPVNDAPVADAETATVLENGSVVIDVVAGDTDVEDGVPDPATVRDRGRRRRRRPGEDGGRRGRLERRRRDRGDHLHAGAGLRRRGDADRLHHRRQRGAALGPGGGQRDDPFGQQPDDPDREPETRNAPVLLGRPAHLPDRGLRHRPERERRRTGRLQDQRERRRRQ